MIRLLDWYALARNAKQLNWPKSVYLRNLVLVNVSSAIGIAVGFLPSTSPTDVLSINTGSGSGTLLIGMPWTFLAALLLPAGAPAPIRLFLLGKARELSPLPFLTQLSIEENFLILNRLHEIHSRCHQRLQLNQVPLLSLTLAPGPEYGIIHCKAYCLDFSPLKHSRMDHWSTDHYQLSYLSAFQSSPYRTCLTKAISCRCLAALAFPSCRAETLRYPNCSPFLLAAAIAVLLIEKRSSLVGFSAWS